jgi:cytochrome d ubiquinol oxidase subunit I
MEHTTEAARVLMGDSLGFHIIFVLLSLTVPILVSWFEFLGLKHKSDKDIATARVWSKIAGLLAVTGVISGTIIALQMSLVWPGILKFGGQVIGLPFMFETYAFFIEAVFLALYLTTWNKVNKWLHWVFGLFVIIGSSGSAFAITSINSWMNYPTGFDYVHGKIVNVNVWSAMFSRTSLVEFFHSMPAYFLAGSLFFVSVYAIKLLRTKRNGSVASYRYSQLVLKRLMILAVLMFVACGITGDITGKYLAKYEPTKLASLELNYHTRADVPLLIGGVGRSDGSVVGPHFEVPYALSILAGNIPSKVVQGVDNFAPSERAPLVLHTFFNIKMTLLDLIALVFVLYFGLYCFRRDWLTKRPVLVVIALAGISAIAMVELGWMITEIGRQPWAVRGYVTTAQAVTQSHTVAAFGFLFPTGFLALLVLTIVAARKIIRGEREVKAGSR